jgi:hypothetical protein
VQSDDALRFVEDDHRQAESRVPLVFGHFSEDSAARSA